LFEAEIDIHERKRKIEYNELRNQKEKIRINKLI